MPREDLEKVALRLRKGDKAKLSTFFHPISYNQSIRHIVSTVVDRIEAQGAAIAKVGNQEIEIPDLDEL